MLGAGTLEDEDEEDDEGDEEDIDDVLIGAGDEVEGAEDIAGDDADAEDEEGSFPAEQKTLQVRLILGKKVKPFRASRSLAG